MIGLSLGLFEGVEILSTILTERLGESEATENGTLWHAKPSRSITVYFSPQRPRIKLVFPIQ
jgi:hypothetical protein